MRWHTRKNFEKSAFSRGGWHSRNDPARILSVAHLQVVAFVRGRAWEEWCLEGCRQRGLSPTPWLNITRRSVRILHVFLIGMPWYESNVARGGLTSTVSLSRVGKCLSFPVFLQIFYLSHGCPCYPYLLHYPCSCSCCLQHCASRGSFIIAHHSVTTLPALLSVRCFKS